MQVQNNLRDVKQRMKHMLEAYRFTPGEGPERICAPSTPLCSSLQKSYWERHDWIPQASTPLPQCRIISHLHPCRIGDVFDKTASIVDAAQSHLSCTIYVHTVCTWTRHKSNLRILMAYYEPHPWLQMTSNVLYIHFATWHILLTTLSRT